MLHLDAHVLDDHVGTLDQAHKGSVAVIGFQIERDHTLVAVQVLIVGIQTRAGQVRATGRGRLDADNVGTPIREMAHAVGPARASVRSSTDDVRERQWCVRHGVSNLHLDLPFPDMCTTIDAQQLACYLAGFGEIEHCVGDILCIDYASQRRQGL